MSAMDEGRARDLLPDWLGGRLTDDEAAQVGRAVDADADLAREARMLRELAGGRPEVPMGLADRITAAVREDRTRESPLPARPLSRRGAVHGPWRLPRWAFAAAAVAVLALGTTVVLDGVGGAGEDPVQVALETAASPWATEDEMVAGAPILDGLSDEMLETLLEELGG